ncbi:unnamed protein product [Amoebophrya sp. A25]|nr:unnamed protein product [Amoebophrya sp. A25]|eukprot:GSA25T00024480001.1
MAAERDSDVAINAVGYVFIFLSCAILAALYVPWLSVVPRNNELAVANRSSEDQEKTKDKGPASDPISRESGVFRLSLRQRAWVGIVGALCAGGGNVIAYRIVLAEHLDGTIIERRGVGGVITTLLISLALFFIFGSHCMLLGLAQVQVGGDDAKNLNSLALLDKRTFAKRELFAVGLTLLIVVAKLSMGIVHYKEDCCACTT